jgi:hypothetical protein
MPIALEGSCRCGAIRFRLDSHTPHPYQRCYCGICRKTAGGVGIAASLAVQGRPAVYRARLQADDGRCRLSSGRQGEGNKIRIACVSQTNSA